MELGGLVGRLKSSRSLERLRARVGAALSLESPFFNGQVDARRRFFQSREGNRYWWYRRIRDAYLPECYAILSPKEWRTMQAWFEETDARNLVGECSVPAVSWLSSFVSANDVGRVVQLGTYAGYSTLLLGWTLKRMGKRNALLAVDLDRSMCDFTQEWVARAELDDVVRVHCGDSAAPDLPGGAKQFFGQKAQMVFIDSSHQYAHTLQELDLWYASLEISGLIVMHDTSEYAATFDSSGQGGVRRALEEWRGRTQVEALNLSYPKVVLDTASHVYMDGCGLGIVVKR